jgi:muramoyltetrapeptide carboxypeptidase
MNRKYFLSSVITLPAILPTFAGNKIFINDEELAAPLPVYLKPGHTIGITSPAGYVTEADVQPALLQMQQWGLHVKQGSTIGKRDFTFGGTASERIADFQQMLDDDSIHAIMCARGGYGFVTIIDKLDFTRFKKKPKWIIGFSDITVLHSHLNRQYGIASIHSKMCNSFPADWNKAEPIQIETIESIKDALMGKKMNYVAPVNANNRMGIAEGKLVGGNLKTLESLAGSASDIKTSGKILFVEDTGEYLYSIDRMFWNLKRSGKLDNLAGLIIGGFKIKPAEDVAEEFGKNLYDIVLEKVKDYKYPVCFDFPVGHQKNNFALKCGIRHRLLLSDKETLLQEVR